MGNDLSPQAKEKLISIKNQDTPPDFISLSNCCQKSYPKFLKNYPQLKRILMDHNFLSTVPKNVKFNIALEELDVSFNNITDISLELTELSHLRRLNLANNTELRSVPCLPSSVTALDISGTLVKIDGSDATINLPPGLKELGLAAMRLIQIPSGTMKLSGLRKLTCQITT